MPESRFQRLERLFDEASSLDGVERDAFVDELTRKEPEIGRAVGDLLRHAGDETSYSEALSSVAASALSESGMDRITPGSRIGGIEIVMHLGSGGMGEVYLGQQTEPLKREVAVKLVRSGMLVDQVLARFEAERQTLARMNHSHIAQVYDAGTLDSGQPFFVMEYIRGEPIDAYVRTRNSSLAERLDLFSKVCDGVQHAHRRGVIHRDLKPSNVLVDGNGQPKIIDFGIAKLVEEGQDAKLTQFDQTLGTPQYMSPEQASFQHDEVDTRSDVYALGVLLFELLTQTSPFETEGKSPLEVRQLICDVDPRRASDAVGGDVPYTGSDLAGDLEWIVARALAREKDRRYGSPAELAADIERYRAHEPVLAGPDELFYRMRKFTRRHRTGVAVASVAFVTVVAGVAGTLIGLSRALEAERAAAESAEIANQTVSFIEEIFSAADSTKMRGEQITAREVVDQGVTQIQLNEELPWRTRSSLLQTMGRVYSGLGLYTDAIPLFEASTALHESNAAPEDLYSESYFASRLGRISALRAMGDLNAAAELIDDLIEDEIRAFGPNDGRLVDSRIARQGLFTGIDDIDAAREHLGATLALMDETDASDRKRAFLFGAAAPALVAAGDYERAINLGREAVDLLTESLGPDHPDTLAARANLAWYLSTGRRFVDAEREFDTIIESTERIFGKDHFGLGITLFNLGGLQRNIGRYEDARQNYARAGEIWGDQLGPDHSYVLVAKSNVAQLHYDLGDYEKSEAMYLDLIEQERRLYSEDDPERAFALNNLGMVYHAVGDLQKAEALLSEAQNLRINALGEAHPFVLDGYVNLGRIAGAKGDVATARASLQKAIDIATERFDENHSIVARASRVMGKMLIGEGEANEALEHLSRAIRGFENEYAEGYWETAAARSAYGEALMMTNDLDGAEENMRRGLDNLLASEDRNSSHTRDAVERLIRLYALTSDEDKQAEMRALLETLGDDT